MDNPSHSSNGLPREERLRGHATVSQLFGEGVSGFVYPIRYLWIEDNEQRDAEADKGGNDDKESTTEVLFTVPKRLHKRANRRNLLRRRIKESYRLQKEILSTSVDTGELNVKSKPLKIALIYATKEILDYPRIARSVAKILTQISEERGRR